MSHIVVLFFGGLKEALACGRLELPLAAAEQIALTRVYHDLCSQHLRLPSLMASVRLALNEEFLPGMGETAVDERVMLRAGDVVAFIPPVTGG